MLLQLWLCFDAIRAFLRITSQRRRRFDILRYAVGLDMAASFHIRFWEFWYDRVLLIPATPEQLVALMLKTATLLFLIRVIYLKERRL